MPGADDIALLRALSAHGRFTGTAALTTARAQCTSRLRELGFDVHDRPFEYSTIPARFGMAVVGVASIVLLSAAVAMRHVGPIGSAGAFALGLAALAAISHWFTSARALRLRAARTGGVNLEATRGAEPRVWLVAHLDSKSQRYPLAIRAAGAAVTGGAWLMLALQIAWVVIGGSWWAGWC